METTEEKPQIKEITEEEARALALGSQAQEEQPQEQPKPQDAPIEEKPQDKPTDTGASEEKPLEEQAPQLDVDDDGKVVFNEEMEKEINDKIKELNPDISEEDLKAEVETQKSLINEKYGKKPAAEETTSTTEEKPTSIDSEFGINKSEDGKIEVDNEKIRPILNNQIAKLTEGKYNSIESLIDEHNDIKSKLDYEFVHPSVKKLNEVLGKTKDMSEDAMLNFIKVQSMDYEKLDDFNLIAEAIRLDEPDITNVEVQDKLNKFDVLKKSKEEVDEMIEDGDITQIRYEALKNEYARMSKNSLVKLKKNQENLKVSLTPTQEELESINKKPNEEAEKILEQYHNQVSEKIPTFTVNKVPTSKDKDGNPVYFDYKVTEEERKKTEATAKNVNTFFNRYQNQQTGEYDYMKMFSDFHLLENIESVMAAATAQSAIKERKSAFGEINNYQFLSSPSSRSTSTPKKTHQQAIAEGYNKAMKG